ncbi:hypothetical protein Taro_047979 [Colocasia esculenta]|uniref:Uncharacterized protein n=1 Tax=Colocasia esculenta TaxID=4460 RepID=A0A843WUG4_COLES|nr:hypothetical protein [Colocasia esculenta]
MATLEKGVFTPFLRTAPSLPFYHPRFAGTYESVREREREHTLSDTRSSSSSDFDRLSMTGNLLLSTSTIVELPLSPLLPPSFTRTSHRLRQICVRLPPLTSFTCDDRESSAVDIAFIPLQNLLGSHATGAHGLLLSHTGLPTLVFLPCSPYLALGFTALQIYNVSKDLAMLDANLKKLYHLYESLRTRSGWGWDEQRNVPIAPDEESIQAAIALPTITLCPLQQTNSDLAKLIDKPFPYKQQMDILCGKTTVRGSHFLGSTQDVDVDLRRSFGDADNSTRQGFSAMGLDSQQVQSIDDDNFNPFDFPPLTQPPSYENTQTQNTPIEDEATSPNKRRTTQAQSSQSRKRRSKKSSELLTLAQYCQLNDQRMKLEKSLFPQSSSSTASKDVEQYTVRECVSQLKTMVGYSQELLMRALPLFEIPSKRVVFMSLDEEDAMVNGYPGARYKGFATVEEGNMAFRGIIMRQTSSANDTVPFQASSVVHETQPREAEERVVYRDAILEENAMFMAVGEMLMSSIMDEDEEDTTPIPRPMHTSRHTGHAIALLRFTYIGLPSGTDLVHPRIRHDDWFYPYFKVWCWLVSTVLWLVLVERQLDLSSLTARLRGSSCVVLFGLDTGVMNQ